MGLALGRSLLVLFEGIDLKLLATDVLTVEGRDSGLSLLFFLELYEGVSSASTIGEGL